MALWKKEQDVSLTKLWNLSAVRSWSGYIPFLSLISSTENNNAIILTWQVCWECSWDNIYTDVKCYIHEPHLHFQCMLTQILSCGPRDEAFIHVGDLWPCSKQSRIELGRKRASFERPKQWVLPGNRRCSKAEVKEEASVLCDTTRVPVSIFTLSVRAPSSSQDDVLTII